MLQLFRKYQRALYILITIVIVISFSFFGTYGTLSDGSFREQIAFKAVDGTVVTRHELDEMVAFISTDSGDKVIFGGMWGPNFLNDGVIARNFIDTGLGVLLAEQYLNEIKPDLQARHDKERRYQLYTHPKAPFITTEAAWNYVNPNMTSFYNLLRNTNDPSSAEALRARMALFLMEKQFPAPLLKQVLRYQESQHSWLTPDPNLNYLDLSLFGYHTAEDWFGPRFVRLVAQFIINSAIIAEQRGYEVSKAEALADLTHNAEMSYRQNQNSPHLNVRNSHEYYQEQLRRLGMDQNIAAKNWQKVLLFRRLFQDLGSAQFVDPFSFRAFNQFALTAVEGESYRLPKEFQFNTYRGLQKFEIYLEAIAKRDDLAKLTLPTQFFSLEEISKKSPSLVQKKYVLQIAEASKKAIEAGISLKQTWAWENSSDGWQKLRAQFPDLQLKENTTPSERFTALEALDEKTRQKVDAFARASLIEAHPEWIVEALNKAEPAQKSIALTEAKGDTPFAGFSSGKKLIKILDTAPKLNEEATTEAAKSAASALALFTGDKETYYRIGIVEKSPKAQILTFAEADKSGALDQLLDQRLQEHYKKIREDRAAEFQTASKSWKPFNDVKDQIADDYFRPMLGGIYQTYASVYAAETKLATPEKVIGDLAATYRLYPYVKGIQEKISKQPSLAATLTREATPAAQTEASKPNGSLADQWKLIRTSQQLTKSSTDSTIDKEKIFALKPPAFSKVNAPANGDLNFFYVIKRGNQATDLTTSANVAQAHRLLSEGAQVKLMQSLLTEMNLKEAISLDYLKNLSQEEEPANQ